jgi:hypothetical protein
LKGLGNIAFILSLIAGILILISGIFWLVDPSLFDYIGLSGFRASVNGFFDIFGTYPPYPSLIGGLGILFGIIVLIGAYYVYLPAAYELLGGMIVLIFSIISLMTGGGFVIGTILGIIGGILGMARTPESVEEAVIKPKDQEEHERF